MFSNVTGHRFCRNRFPVCRKHHFRRSGQSFQPPQHVFPIGVRRKPFDLFDMAPDRHLVFHYSHLVRAFLYASTRGSCSLIADEDHGRIRVGQDTHCVVKHAAASHHSGRRDNDPRPAHFIHSFRFFARRRGDHRTGPKRMLFASQDRSVFFILFFVPAVIDLRSLSSHRGIDYYGQYRNSPLLF